MLSRLTTRLAGVTAKARLPCVRLASNSSGPSRHRLPVQTQSRIDSNFFRPSLCRSSLFKEASRSKSRSDRDRTSVKQLNESQWTIIGVALALYLTDLQTGTSHKTINWYFGIDGGTGVIRLDERPQGLELHTNQLPKSETQTVIDSDTQQPFSLYLNPPPTSLPSSSGRLKLVGLGVRTVSFLGVRVYVAGLYMDEGKLNSVLAQGGLRADQTLEQLVKKLLDDGTPAVIRIVPVRNTDFNHLRDGFIRALQGRLKKAIQNGHMQSASVTEKGFEESIRQIKESFPRGSVPKGSPLDMVIVPGTTNSGRQQASSLNFEYDGQVFGQVKATAIASDSATSDVNLSAARELVLAYFADKGEISPAFKKSVQSGFSRN